MSSLTNNNVLIGGYRVAEAVIGTGIPVVLIHGTPSSSYIWRKVAPSLVGAGYQVHLFDLLGYGASERPWSDSADTSVSGQVPVLRDLMRHWGLEQAHIVAHDIGAAIAKRLAIFHRPLVRSLTLIDTVSFDSWPSKRTKQQMQAGLEAMIKKPDPEHRAHFAEWLLSAVVNKQRFAEEALDVYLDLISGPIGQGSLFQHQIAQYDHKHTSEISDRLGELADLPVQIIWGADDAWQVVDWAHKLHAAIPNSKLTVVPGCGHFVMEDQPDEISDLVLSFLAVTGR